MSPQEGYYLPKRPLINTNDSSLIQSPEVPRSKFLGSWNKLTTFSAGVLIPFLVDEILPGDHMTYDVTTYVRMATPLFPQFSNQTINTFFFFVPNRILWTNWVKLMGEQNSPGDSIAYTVPQIQIVAADVTVANIYDQMGIIKPTGANTYSINALPFRAYNRIYNDWFRDENIINRLPVNTGDTSDASSDYGIARRAKMHDYFTSCLPWPQKFTAPTVGLSPAAAPVVGIGIRAPGTIDGLTYYDAESNNPVYAYSGFAGHPAGNYIAMRTDTAGTPLIQADLSTIGFTINTMRQAFMIQALLERDARGGTRYTEKIMSHFKVRNPDYRLQRPEYIGGGQTPLMTTPVAQTTPTTGLTVGALGAAATGAGQHHASYAATEHGFIIGLIEVHTELAYQQGLHKMWTRSTMYDYYFPATAQLGEQAVLQKEIYATGVANDDNTIFGYQERWHEYRVRYSETAGYFRSTWAGPLDAWHLAQNFSPAPTLNTAFINETPPMDRILAAGSAAQGQQYLSDIMIRRAAVRPMPTYGTPALLGRF